jgi:2-polyprenyl-3-methyl-5-hydroxy-6-metoxy-1,4-benzoquinol methylase
MNWQSRDLISVACDLCGSAKSRVAYIRPDGLKVVECSGCGLHYLNPRPRDEKVSALYDKDYFRKAGANPNCGYQDYSADWFRNSLLVSAAERIAVLGREYDFSSRRVLEIGCATGESCYLLRRGGAEPVGVDIAEAAIALACSRYPGIDFRSGGIESIAPPECFDLIVAFEVIEHVLSPKEFFRRASTLLREGGALVLSTPNLDCGRNVGFDRWRGFHESLEHLYFFDLARLTDYGRNGGLKVQAWYGANGDGRIQDEPTPDPNASVRKLLAKTGLLQPIRSLRRIALVRRMLKKGYDIEERGFYLSQPLHNLTVVLRKECR